jgi:hypothetical protein
MRRGILLIALSCCFSVFGAEVPKTPRACFEPTKTNAPVLKFQEPRKFKPGAELSKLDLGAPEYIRAWRKFMSLDEYLRRGKTNALWDKAAIEALKLYCDLGALNPESSESATTTKRLYEAATRALEAGCDDPLIQYLKWNYTPLDESSEGRWKLTRGSLAAAEGMEKSSYPPICKALAGILACDASTKAVSSDMGPKLIFLTRATIHHMDEALHDPAIPSTVSTNVADVIKLGTIRDIETNDDLHTILFPTLEKECKPRGFSYELRANYFIVAAWNSRGNDYADKVSEAQFKVFDRCLVKAEDILRTGWEADPKDSEIPALMIQICTGRSLPRAEMEKWFDRAMALDPNNSNAAFQKANYLSPKWLGTVRDVIAFGYECANSPRWGGSVPLVLVFVHQDLQRITGIDPAKYFGQAIVWRDLRVSYEKYFRLNPTDTETRPKFARDAFYGGDYKLFLEQMDKAGPNVNYFAVFGGEEQFEEMKKKALAAVSI